MIYLSKGGFIISSYKGHTIFAFVLSLIIFQNPFAVILSLIGANLPDFDHNVRRLYVILIFLVGALISIVLYHFNLPFYLGIVISALSVIFLFSSHRGFTHSFLGIIVQGLILGLILYFATNLLISFNLFESIHFVSSKLLIVSLVLLFMSILFLNKNFLSIVLLLIIFLLWKFHNFEFTFFDCIFPIFLGLLSHMILDSFTPSGVKPFIPFSDKKVYKKFGIVMIILIILVFLCVYYHDFLYLKLSGLNNLFIQNF